MSEIKYCSNCGNSINKSVNFCENCGASLKETQVSNVNQTISNVQTTVNSTQTQQEKVTPQNKAADWSITLGFIAFCFVVTGIPAIILGIIGLKNPYGQSRAILGILAGGFATAVYIVGLVIAFT